jgi:hypothetical protein
MYHNPYDEKTLARSREPIDTGGRTYVNWHEYQDAPDYRPLVWIASLLIVSLIVWAVIALS